jgi:hypothetical protein
MNEDDVRDGLDLGLVDNTQAIWILIPGFQSRAAAVRKASWRVLKGICVAVIIITSRRTRRNRRACQCRGLLLRIPALLLPELDCFPLESSIASAAAQN